MSPIESHLVFWPAVALIVAAGAVIGMAFNALCDWAERVL